jgi:hypothetical protein
MAAWGATRSIAAIGDRRLFAGLRNLVDVRCRSRLWT